MSNDANEYPKMLLNVDLNAKIVIESDLCANVRFFALINVSSRCLSPFRVYLGVRTCDTFSLFRTFCFSRFYCADFFVFFVLRHP